MQETISTQWSLIVRAQSAQDPQQRKTALHALFQRYQPTIDAIVTRCGVPPGDSVSDVRQSFLVHLLASGSLDKLTQVDGRRGRFRAWLRTLVKRHVIDKRRRWQADKRGNQVTGSLSFDPANDPSATPTGEDHVWRTFAVDTFTHVNDRLRKTYPSDQEFDVLERFLLGPRFDPTDREEACRLLGNMPRQQFRNRLHRLRRTQTQFLKEAVYDYMRRGPGMSLAEYEEEVRLEMIELCKAMLDVLGC